MKSIKYSVLSSIAVAASLLSSAAAAGTVIYNTGNAATAQVALGVNADGSLNTTPDITANASATGIAFKFADGSWRDATAPGCLCEGWGVSVNGVAGYANQAAGGAGLLVGAVTSVTGSSVTTTAQLSLLPGIEITQAYAAASNAPGVFFKNTVTIKNTTGSAVNNVRYVRVMDWDVPPTEFGELVTIKGTGTTSALEKSHLDGFAGSNPLDTSCDAGCGYGGVDVDVTDAGPSDHGAYFRFNFGTLAAGASYSFDVFYGATSSEAAALAAIGAEGIELYSLGQSSGGGTTGSPATFIFGFSGVGGTPLEGGDVPEPASIALAGVALAALGVSRRRRGVKG